MTKVKANALWNNLTSDQLKALPELQKVAEAMGDADATRYRETANEAKRAMFGSGEEVLPESAREEGEAGCRSTEEQK